GCGRSLLASAPAASGGTRYSATSPAPCPLRPASVQPRYAVVPANGSGPAPTCRSAAHGLHRSALSAGRCSTPEYCVLCSTHAVWRYSPPLAASSCCFHPRSSGSTPAYHESTARRVLAQTPSSPYWSAGLRRLAVRKRLILEWPYSVPQPWARSASPRRNCFLSTSPTGVNGSASTLSTRSGSLNSATPCSRRKR